MISERAIIIAWLRDGENVENTWGPYEIADALERGDHMLELKSYRPSKDKDDKDTKKTPSNT